MGSYQRLEQLLGILGFNIEMHLLCGRRAGRGPRREPRARKALNAGDKRPRLKGRGAREHGGTRRRREGRRYSEDIHIQTF